TAGRVGGEPAQDAGDRGEPSRDGKDDQQIDQPDAKFRSGAEPEQTAGGRGNDHFLGAAAIEMSSWRKGPQLSVGRSALRHERGALAFSARKSEVGAQSCSPSREAQRVSGTRRKSPPRRSRKRGRAITFSRATNPPAPPELGATPPCWL